MNSTNVMKQYVCLLNRGGTVEAVLDDDGKIKVDVGFQGETVWLT